MTCLIAWPLLHLFKRCGTHLATNLHILKSHCKIHSTVDPEIPVWSPNSLAVQHPSSSMHHAVTATDICVNGHGLSPVMYVGSQRSSTFWMPVPTLQLFNTVALHGTLVHLCQKELPLLHMMDAIPLYKLPFPNGSSTQWYCTRNVCALLHIHLRLMVTRTSTCHMLLSVSTHSTCCYIFGQKKKKNSCHNVLSDPCTWYR